MRWEDLTRSTNVEDRRGMGGGFGGGGIRIGGGRGLGIGGVIVVLIASAIFGFDPRILLDGGVPIPMEQPQSRQATNSPEQNRARDFVAAVLGDTERTWGEIFRKNGQAYREPKLVLFTGAVESACGYAQAAVGPFYCPADQKVYLDLSFFAELQQRFRAPGDFAQAYVIAHEVGHHVQTLMGTSNRVRATQQRVSRTEANAIQVRMELQADCYSGIWAHHADRFRKVLEPGDIDEALNAASAIGDDRLQRQAQGRVVPDSFTHGSSAQRMRWFKRGFESGDLKACDTFGANQL
ncbi:MAG: neutral zinc metallopeptidase [Rhodospirillaceae bacterium]|nr:neutral zinc metallopeptidase [Rhodospirillaceae bacterium]